MKLLGKLNRACLGNYTGEIICIYPENQKQIKAICGTLILESI